MLMIGVTSYELSLGDADNDYSSLTLKLFVLYNDGA